MIGILLMILYYLGMPILFVAFFVGLSWIVGKIAQKLGYKGWIFGICFFLLVLVYFVVEWELSNTQYKNFCEKEAGLVVYKTPEQWQKENPNVWETLKYEFDYLGDKSHKGEKYEIITYSLNQRFIEEEIRKEMLFSIVKSQESIIDVKTGEKMLSYTTFSTNIPPIFGPSSMSFTRKSWMPWLMKNTCQGGKSNSINLRQRLVNEQRIFRAYESTLSKKEIKNN